MPLLIDWRFRVRFWEDHGNSLKNRWFPLMKPLFCVWVLSSFFDGNWFESFVTTLMVLPIYCLYLKWAPVLRILFIGSTLSVFSSQGPFLPLSVIILVPVLSLRGFASVLLLLVRGSSRVFWILITFQKVF